MQIISNGQMINMFCKKIIDILAKLHYNGMEVIIVEIISERQRVETISHSRCFESEPYCGFSFLCDENGNIEDLNDCAMRNYQDCLDGRHPNLKDVGVRKNIDSYIQAAIGICDKCGREVELTDDYCGATSCEKCGEWYTMNGQHIKPPELWEEPIDDDY